MPKIFELFGHLVENRDFDVERGRKQAHCPFTASRCDGGGNRHQTAIDLSDAEDLRQYFDDEVERVVPGVCSIAYSGEQWIVCPRRLMGFKSENEVPTVNEGVLPREKAAFREGGLPLGVELGVWPEVNLRYENAGETNKYRFDFVVAPVIVDSTLERLFEIHGIEDDEKKDEIVTAGRRGDWISGRRSPDMRIPAIPNLQNPFVVEVMTASTSGSNRSKRTDIASSFEDAILQREHESPGINKRQVWGRMITQLFAKSALAESWGGKALWVVQEEFLDEIEAKQQLDLDATPSANESAINFVWASYEEREEGEEPHLEHKDTKSAVAGVDFNGSATCADILIPEHKPPRSKLLEAVLRSELAARLRL